MVRERSTLISGIFLISGTCMGAGMLALPVVTGPSGFLPALTINACCWLFMMATGLLFLEATLWMHDDANVISMAERFFGLWGKIIAGGAFLFLYYCLEVSYISGGAPMLIAELPLENLPEEIGYLIFSGLFGLLIFLGTGIVDRLNWLLMTAAILSFIILLAIGSGEVRLPLLQRQHWALMFFAAPTLFSAFGYHNIVPTLTFYMKRDRNRMRLAILLGTLLPFTIYSLWQWMIIGSLSVETIEMAKQEGVPITTILHNITGHPWVSFLGAFFGFFAIITSLLGVSLSMIDFMGDGLSLKRTGWQRLLLTLIVLLPPTVFAALHPGIFNTAIAIAGGYGEAILNGLFPIGLVWAGRYSYKLNTERELFGGRPMLLLLLAITIGIIWLETKILIGS